jgi:hypothetical protein
MLGYLELFGCVAVVLPVALYFCGHKSGAKEIASAEKTVVEDTAKAVDSAVSSVADSATTPPATTPAAPASPSEPASNT